VLKQDEFLELKTDMRIEGKRETTRMGSKKKTKREKPVTPYVGGVSVYRPGDHLPSARRGGRATSRNIAKQPLARHRVVGQAQPKSFCL
jgi:hypothetical protein